MHRRFVGRVREGGVLVTEKLGTHMLDNSQTVLRGRIDFLRCEHVKAVRHAWHINAVDRNDLQGPAREGQVSV